VTALGLRAEREYPVPPLPLPPLPLPADPAVDPDAASVEELASSPAVALFLDRARAVHPGFALTERNAHAVAEICRRLEGLPLAIELAAARTRLLDPDALLGRLTRSLDALGTGTVDLPERQRTLRATVDWSVGLLHQAERSLLETMAVFMDGWTIEAAAQVAGLDEDRALELSEALARHSLIQIDTTDLGPRSRMLDTIREFVAERLDARPDVDAVRGRHADHYRALAERADRPLRGIGQNRWADRLEAEAGNLAAAVRWYLANGPAPLPHLFRVMYCFWLLRDHLREAHHWIERLMPLADGLDPHDRAELLWVAAMNAMDVGDDEAALAARRDLEPLLDRIADPFLDAMSKMAMAWTMPLVGDLDRFLRWALAGLDQLCAQDEPFWTATAAATAGLAETAMGRYGDAGRHLAEMQALAARFDNAWLATWSHAELGILAVATGRIGEARRLLDDALELSLAVPSTHAVVMCVAAFARLAFAEGDAERAALLIGAADGLRRRVGLWAWPMMRRGEAELIAKVREALGASRFDATFAAGARLNRREAVAAVRGRSGAGTAAPRSG
jgi:predicted ATPase